MSASAFALAPKGGLLWYPPSTEQPGIAGRPEQRFKRQSSDWKVVPFGGGSLWRVLGVLSPAICRARAPVWRGRTGPPCRDTHLAACQRPHAPQVVAASWRPCPLPRHFARARAQRAGVYRASGHAGRHRVDLSRPQFPRPWPPRSSSYFLLGRI